MRLGLGAVIVIVIVNNIGWPEAGRADPPVADRNGELRKQLEELQAEAGPDVSLADVIRCAIRAYIAAQKQADLE